MFEKLKRAEGAKGGGPFAGKIFPAVNLDDLKKELRPEAEGITDGRNERPASDSKDLDAHEEAIVEGIRSLRSEASDNYREHMRVYRERVEADQIVPGSINTTVDRLKTEIKRHEGELEDTYQDHLKVEDELNEFKRDNRIFRTPHAYKGILPWLGVTAVLVSIETFMNGVFFKDLLEKGWTDGILVAFIISFTNVLAASIFAHFFRNANHIGLSRKIFGCLMLPCGVCFALAGNLFVGHVRDVSEKVPLNLAPSEIFKRLSDGPYLMESLSAWMLFALGVAFAAIAGWKSYTTTDPYPGYGRVWRKFVATRDKLRDRYEQTLEELEELYEEATEELRLDLENARQKTRDAKNAYMEMQALQNSLFHALEEYDVTVNRLLNIYRDANRQNRSTTEPIYFVNPYQFPLVPPDTLPPPPDSAFLQSLQEKIDATNMQISEEYRNALSSFDRYSPK